MGKFVGWKCDVCSNAENGNDAPEDWLRLRLPGNGTDNTRDFCSDKCLLKFAKERTGTVAKPKRPKSEVNSPALLEFLTARGVTGSGHGGVIGSHVRRRHEVAGMVDDCLVCEFLTMEGE